ncbi:outer membrane beta-barrel protein [Hymenobacter sp. CRA2]|uniref:outer membrane beta-barrel protein n=1 Tax=Hymenobacter sp. CRA2 TaxID=1955620 RepID=UPI0011163FCA|nr:outer membrane beta-barrel protein [Hymenobacter sp. CRA2]
METYRKDEATNVVINSYQNFRSAESLDGSVTLVKPLLNNKWATVTTLGVSYAKLSASSGLGGARPSVFLSSNHTITLPKGFKAEVSGMYMSPMTFGGLAFKSRYGLDLGVSKSVLQGAGTFALNVSDVLNTQRNRYEVLNAGVRSMNVGKAESRFVRLSFNYKFGKKTVKPSKRRDTGVEGEKGRMDLN